MINSVEIHNFKNLRELRINFERVTVFVGANASGKSSILQAIHLALAASGRDPESVFEGEQHCAWLYTRDGNGPLSISCSTSGGQFAPAGGTFQISATFPHSPVPDTRAEDFGWGRWHFSVTPKSPSELADASEGASPIEFVRFDLRKLAQATYSRHTPPSIDVDGEGLASVLAYMALSDPDGFDALVEKMRELIPQLTRLRFTKSLIQETETELVKFGNDTLERQVKRDFQGDAILFDFQNAQGVPAHGASEGTLMLLGLLTILLGPRRPNVLLLDDIESGLHPAAQKSLLNALREAMRKFPKLQIIATTHSPYLVDYLEPQEVRLVTLGDDGHAVCGQLTDHPKFNQWKDEMAPGELWSSFGEKWLVAERNH